MSPTPDYTISWSVTAGKLPGKPISEFTRTGYLAYGDGEASRGEAVQQALAEAQTAADSLLGHPGLIAWVAIQVIYNDPTP